MLIVKLYGKRVSNDCADDQKILTQKIATKSWQNSAKFEKTNGCAKKHFTCNILVEYQM